MKLTKEEIVGRAALVDAQLRGADALPEGPSRRSEVVVRRCITAAASEAVAALVQERSRGGPDSFSFEPRALLNRALGDTQPGSFWSGMTSEILAPRLEESLHHWLAMVGLEAGVRFSQRRDGETVVHLVNIRPRAVSQGSPRALERVTQGPTGGAELDPRPVLAAAHQILERVADRLAALGPALRDPAFRSDAGASTTRKLTAELEKAAQQLSVVSKLGVAESSPESRAVQKAYVKLLSALSDPQSYYRSAQLVDDDVRTFQGQQHGVLEWIAGVLSSPERLRRSGFEARIQAALGKIYEQAPLLPPAPRASPPEVFLAGLFPLLPPGALRDPATAHLLIDLGRTEEAARVYEIGGDNYRAMAARRHQAHELAVVFGPSLVTGDAIARLGESAKSLGDATFACAGALRCYKAELPPDHWLVHTAAAKLKHTGEAWLKSLSPGGGPPVEDYARWATEWVDHTNKALDVQGILRRPRRDDGELPKVAQHDDWARALQLEAPLEPPYRWSKKTSAELAVLAELRSAIYGPLPGQDRAGFLTPRA